MTTLKILRAARALYERSPSHVGGVGLPEEGTICPLLALTDAAEDIDCLTRRTPAVDRLRAAMGTTSIVDWNATHTTLEVLAAFDRAILAELALTEPAGASL